MGFQRTNEPVRGAYPWRAAWCSLGLRNASSSSLLQPERAFLPDNCTLHASRFTLYAECYVQGWECLLPGQPAACGQSLALHGKRTVPTAWLTSPFLLQVKQRLAAAIKAFLHFDSDGSPEYQGQQAPQDGAQEALGSNFVEHNGVGPGEEDGM